MKNAQQKLSSQRRLGSSLSLLGLLLLLTTPSYADITQQSGKVLIQNLTSPGLYVFCSQVNSTILLDRVDFNNPGVQAGWSSQLLPHTCSIFFANKNPLVFSCSEKSSVGASMIDCKKDLLVGPLTWSGKMLSQATPTTSYWVAESISVDDVTLVARHRQFDV